ncbi:cupin domain-containing protein [Macrococcus equipercicus]|uniref:Acireductone dioxygenase n=1 Tax=Macrococcus equipercicus TaxID=69967 RepID=A0A9Q9BP78_9STAP|nr:cupin domain-containing protein [Macrococcus equipercicus]KAA1037631.1 cupin domain-containing protein [Macrococcus equipercicus]UTH14145.1 cupin domain-containing protein [Macrococcus equipercicus]
MTTIKLQQSGREFSNPEEVKSFLENNEVIYEQWDTTKLPEALVENYQLSDEDKQTILDTYKEEIADISERRGYKASDVISLSSATPNIEQLLENFNREHHHTDDEVRLIVSGNGVFVIQGKDGEFFEVHLNPGDLISVPPNIRHYFTLADNRKVVAVRIFVDEAGWVPVYEETA